MEVTVMIIRILARVESILEGHGVSVIAALTLEGEVLALYHDEISLNAARATVHTWEGECRPDLEDALRLFDAVVKAAGVLGEEQLRTRLQEIETESLDLVERSAKRHADRLLRYMGTWN